LLRHAEAELVALSGGEPSPLRKHEARERPEPPEMADLHSLFEGAMAETAAISILLSMSAPKVWRRRFRPGTAPFTAIETSAD